ncbi:unnamed protein product [Effrenium voratum]|uniref:Uncharacterized protein n=1 Tax=Effrenium voratum TaxID=2562239 RepID=A0AA36N0B3_9DINO|nr:unnamed protein product [Effrenium voratum]
MGAAIGALAVEEILLGTLLGTLLGLGFSFGVAAAFELAMQSCSCGDAPDIVQSDVVKFKVTDNSEISASSLMSATLCGTAVQNQTVPYTFSFLIGKGLSDGRPMYHAGLLLGGSFDVSGEAYKYAFAERWNGSVLVTFSKDKHQVLSRLKQIWVGGVLLDDCKETPEFGSVSPAPDMVTFVHEELARKLSTRNFKSPEDLAKNLKYTNCIAFAMRAGLLLAGYSEKQDFVDTCMTAIQG